MTRLHIHLSVDDLERSIIFHSALFGVEPMKQKPDYAKWMLDDPAVSFAISARGATPGLDHLGIQAESEFEMSVLRTRMEAAAMQTFVDGEATCCFAKADKTGNTSLFSANMVCQVVAMEGSNLTIHCLRGRGSFSHILAAHSWMECDGFHASAGGGSSA